MWGDDNEVNGAQLRLEENHVLNCFAELGPESSSPSLHITTTSPSQGAAGCRLMGLADKHGDDGQGEGISTGCGGQGLARMPEEELASQCTAMHPACWALQTPPPIQ